MMLTARDALSEVLAEHARHTSGWPDLPERCACGHWRSDLHRPTSHPEHLADALLVSDFWAKLEEDRALVEAMAPALEGSPALAMIALEALAAAFAAE